MRCFGRRSSRCSGSSRLVPTPRHRESDSPVPRDGWLLRKRVKIGIVKHTPHVLETCA
jgi:hypothetical protein